MLSLERGAKWLLLLVGSAFCVPALAAQMQIQRLERIQPAAAVQPQAATGRAAGGIQRVRFDTRARRFELLLEPNTTLLPGGATVAGVEALRGTVAGAPGSWVRVIRHAGRYSGLFHDGTEVYAIDTAAATAGSSPQAAAMEPDATVLYRLSDTRITGALFDGDAIDASRSGAEAFEQVAEELPATALAVLVTRRLNVGVVVDEELASWGAQTEANVIDRMNRVDAIFSEQVGVHLQLLTTTILDGTTDPFTTSDPEPLLIELRDYREDSSVEGGNGLTHLFTGRDLGGPSLNTVGIAYISRICDRRFAVSLSEANRSPMTDALIAAHEIGHTFGAPHDGDADAACAATPPDVYLMATQLTGNSSFSDCSLQQIAAKVATASCLAPIDAADAALGAALTADLALNQATTVAFNVRSVGTVAVNDVVVEVVLPPSVKAIGAGAEGGSCELSEGPTSDVIVCRLGSLAPGQSRAIEMSLLSSTSGRTNANITLTATNDGLSQNNTSTLRLDTAPGADLTVSIVADDQNLFVNDTATATITLRNLGLADAADAQLTAAFPPGLVPVSVTGTGITCTQQTTGFTCPPIDLAAGAQATVVVGVRATQTGNQRIALSFVSSAPDPQPGNNDAGATFVVTVAAPPPATPSPSGGGGGGLGLPMLGWLAASSWLGFRRAQTRRRSL